MSDSLTLRSRAAQALLRIDRARFLFVLRESSPDIAMPGRWGGFGGSCDPGETFEAALRREVREELQYEIDGATLITEIATHEMEDPIKSDWQQLQIFEV